MSLSHEDCTEERCFVQQCFNQNAIIAENMGNFTLCDNYRDQGKEAQKTCLERLAKVAA